jgi:hypothetical protein
MTWRLGRRAGLQWQAGQVEDKLRRNDDLGDMIFFLKFMWLGRTLDSQAINMVVKTIPLNRRVTRILYQTHHFLFWQPEFDSCGCNHIFFYHGASKIVCPKCKGNLGDLITLCYP